MRADTPTHRRTSEASWTQSLTPRVPAASASQYGPTQPCEADFGSCVSAAVGPFLSAGGNVRALAGCDKNALAERLAPRVQCVGTKPTPAQLAAQLRA